MRMPYSTVGFCLSTKIFPHGVCTPHSERCRVKNLIIFYIIAGLMIFYFDCEKKFLNSVRSAKPSGTSYAGATVSEGSVYRQGMVAVLDFQADEPSQFSLSDRRFLSERAREVVFNSGRYDVVTEENVEILLQSHGTSLEECAEASCELEFGVMVGADYVLTGRLNNIGDYIFVTMRVHNTKTSSLSAATSFRSKNIAEVHREIDQQINTLLKQIN